MFSKIPVMLPTVSLDEKSPGLPRFPGFVRTINAFIRMSFIHKLDLIRALLPPILRNDFAVS